MSYKCYRCHKKLDDGVTKCDKCGAVKINVPKKEDIEKEIEAKKKEYVVESKYSPYLVALSIILNIAFLVFAGINYTDTNLLFLFTGLALISILLGYMFFQNNKWIRTVFAIESVTVFIIIYLCYLFK